MSEMVGTLPSKLWRLLEIAKEDALAILEDKKYRLDMGAWHELGGLYTLKCQVCLAGAVMARRLDAPWGVDMHPGKYPRYLSDKFRAINHVRAGNYINALTYLYQPDYFSMALPREFYVINAYGDKPSLQGSPTKQDIEAFFGHPVMVEFVTLLKEHDL